MLSAKEILPWQISNCCLVHGHDFESRAIRHIQIVRDRALRGLPRAIVSIW
jgi:hypothetical protein